MLSSHLPFQALALPALPQASSALSAGLRSQSSEEVKTYLGHGGVAAVQVEMPAAVEGDGQRAAEAERGGGLRDMGKAEGSQGPRPTASCPRLLSCAPQYSNVLRPVAASTENCPIKNVREPSAGP